VMLDTCAVSHGNLTLSVGTDAAAAAADAKKDAGSVLLLRGGASLADVVKALNAIGATPQDLLAILQAMKAAGSLHAELEVI
ncbi:MAG: flagellar basal body P-ring protein FlgI, partial [Burkholderiales bacterium]|nr:flagellar basal body P-ring protein FlgI [Burkholderiales bacterium]